jgi:hypothetical protein
MTRRDRPIVKLARSGLMVLSQVELPALGVRLEPIRMKLGLLNAKTACLAAWRLNSVKGRVLSVLWGRIKMRQVRPRVCSVIWVPMPTRPGVQIVNFARRGRHNRAEGLVAASCVNQVAIKAAPAALPALPVIGVTLQMYLEHRCASPVRAANMRRTLAPRSV